MVITSFWLMSCRSVKKDKTHSEESVLVEEMKKGIEIKTENSNLNQDIEIKTSVQTGTTTKKTTSKPIDPKKPATVTDKHGKKTILENAELVEEETTSNTNVSENKTEKIQASAKLEATIQNEQKKKVAANKQAAALKVEREWPVKNIIIAILIVIILWRVFINRVKIWNWLKGKRS